MYVLQLLKHMQHTEEGDICIYKAVYIIRLLTKKWGAMPPLFKKWRGDRPPAPLLPTPLK